MSIRILDLRIPMALGEVHRFGFPFLSGGNLREGEIAIPPQSVTVFVHPRGADVTAQMVVEGSQQFQDGVLSALIQGASVGVYLAKFSTATNGLEAVHEYLRFRVNDPNAG